MTSPETTPTPAKQVDISEFADRWYELRVKKRIMDDATKDYETSRDKLKKFIGDADEIVINGKSVATHPRGAFNRAKFFKENPTLASKYMEQVFAEKFNEEKFASENPALWLGYKSRSLRAKDGE